MRMLDGGCDPLYIARRMIRVASEDIGNADPRALRISLDAWEVLERLGSPEGELALAQAIVYLACAAKSNAVYLAAGAARDDARRFGSLEVPMHLRNAPTRLMKDVGYGHGYEHAHDRPDAVVEMDCLPPSLAGRHYYHPSDRGVEQRIQERLAEWRRKRAKQKAD